MSALKSTLTFLSRLIWQAIVVLAVFAFRPQVAALLEKLWRSKVGGAEFEFQKPTDEPIEPAVTAEDAEDRGALTDASGFFSSAGVNYIVAKSSLVEVGENVVGNLLIFSTSRQHTWLVVTNRQLFCLFDDEETSASGRVVQWHMKLESADPVRVRQLRKGVGLLDVARRRNWYASLDLFGGRQQMEEEVRKLITLGRRS